MTDILHTTISPCENERRIFNQCFSATGKGFTVKIFALQMPGLSLHEEKRGVSIDRISIKKWKKGFRKFLSFNFKLLWNLLRSDFKILHAHDLWVLPASATAAAVKRKKLIYDAHEFYRGLEIFTQKPLSGKIWRFAERLFIRRVDAVLTVNLFHAEFYRQAYPQIIAPLVIRNFPRKNDFQEEKKYLLFSNRPAVILYQGILKTGRGLEKIVRMLPKMKNVRLEIIGYGEMEARLKSLVTELKLEKRVIFRGKIDWNKLLLETQKAKAGLVLFEPINTNYQYASPNKLFEYVMAGTPVVASRIPTFEKFFSEFEVGILVNPDSEEEIRQAVQKLLWDENIWRKFHRNCLKAREVWNWELQEKKLLELYRNLSFGENS